MDALANLIGESPAILAVQAQLRRLLSSVGAARRIPPVLLCGETGTGKGLLARSLHAAGSRTRGPFVSVNCAAIPDTLLEAELFGFERGAFTDARHAKPGLFQEANGGTLFLDEVGLLPPSLQVKLLTALDERRVRRLGATQSEPIDCWVIAATSVDLDRARTEGHFREDLYHRLSVFTIALPPLRDRGDDVLRLADVLLDRVCEGYGLPHRTLHESARAALARYRWPGNVRELENVLERAALLSDTAVIGADALPLPSDNASREEAALSGAFVPSQPSDLRESLEDFERSRLLDALNRAHWNVALAADMLGIARNTLRYRIEKLGLARPAERVPRRRTIMKADPPVPLPTTTAAPQSLRWETRTTTWMRVTVGSASVGDAGRLLAIFGGKVTTFGGEILQQTPRSLDAAFGLEASEDAPVRAANTALAIQKEAARCVGPGETSSVRLALHTSRGAVGLGQGRPWLDPESVRAADEALGTLLATAAPGRVALSRTVAPLLSRRFALLISSQES